MPTPQFSVVLPTCRREDLLARCLESLRPGSQLADPASYEVIVSDDAKGPTAEAMMRAQFPWARWLKGPSRGPAANRNHGVHHATGEWICFIDDDCEASREWISALHDAVADPGIDMIEGRTLVPVKPDNPFMHAIANENGGIFWTCNLAVRRARFLELGGFDEDFLEAAGEDMEFAHRFHAHPLRSKFYPPAVVYHPVRRIGWRTIWNRVLMIRWSALYAYKTSEGLHLSDPAGKNFWRAFKDMIMNHLRRTVQEARRWNDNWWRDRWFTCALRWVTFPIAFPYYLYWVLRFHRELNARQRGAAQRPLEPSSAQSSRE
jgi:GT2 family glycosyltransferase